MNSIKILVFVGFLSAFICITEGKERKSLKEDDFDLSSDEKLCQSQKCGKRPKGSWCEIVEDENGEKKATCVCPTSCNSTDVSPVCSVFGRQYVNRCFLHKEACKKRKNIKIAYVGPCIASQAKCRPDELQQFPFRLLDWFIHLKDTDEFGTPDPRKTITSISYDERQDVADWKFQLLDKNEDGKLNARELKQFRFALMPLEHCAKDFFKKCDDNGNKKLEEREWHSCLVEEGWEWFQQKSGLRPENSKVDAEIIE